MFIRDLIASATTRGPKSDAAVRAMFAELAFRRYARRSGERVCPFVHDRPYCPACKASSDAPSRCNSTDLSDFYGPVG